MTELGRFDCCALMRPATGRALCTGAALRSDAAAGIERGTGDSSKATCDFDCAATVGPPALGSCGAAELDEADDMGTLGARNSPATGDGAFAETEARSSCAGAIFCAGLRSAYSQDAAATVATINPSSIARIGLPGGAGGRPAEALSPAWCCSKSSVAPQAVQNFADMLLPAPQFAHRLPDALTGSRCAPIALPQPLQNLALAEFSRWQLEHFICR